MMNSLENFAQELDKKIWKTKGSRYNKYRRYEGKNSFSLASISILTLYVLALNLALYFPVIEFTEKEKQLVSFLLIVLSVFILILSLLEASKQYQLKAERLYNCSNQLTRLYNELRLFISSADYSPYGAKKLESLIDKYEVILNRYPENHDTIDYELFQAEHRTDFKMSECKRYYIYVKAFLISYWLYLVLVILPPLFCSYLLSF